jgi:hypothetical protein
MAEGGLTEEQRAKVNEATAHELIKLLEKSPELARDVPARIITTVFLAGAKAGVEAYDAVLGTVLEEALR